MELARYEYLKASLRVFSLSLLQDLISVLRSLSEHDIEIKELVEYVIENQKIFAGETAKRNIEDKAMAKYCHCPDCGSGLIFETVNESRQSIIMGTDKNGKKYQSMATCEDEAGCGWQVFSSLSFSVLLRSFFPDSVKSSLGELTRTPHGMKDL